MLTETGRIVALESGAAWVETVRKTTCGSCSLQKGCGHGLMNKMLPGRQPLVRALPGKLDLADCKVGDEVEISIPESVILRGSAVVYLLPLLCMLAAAAIGAALWPANPDAGAGVGSIGGFFVGYLLVRAHARRHRDDQSLQPALVSILRGTRQSLQIA